jgi:hypothetical protein
LKQIRGCSIKRQAGDFAPVKPVTEYLEHAFNFERLAAAETNPAAKKQMQEQSKAYHKLAAKRAKELNVTLPSRRPGAK